MPRVEIREPTAEDAVLLVGNLSEENGREVPAIRADYGVDPLDGVLTSLYESEWRRVVLFDGKIAVIVGVARREWGGQVWLVTSREAEKFPLALYKSLRSLLFPLKQRYGVLMNVAHAGNARSIAMFERMGCGVVDLGLRVGGEKFVHVRWEAPCASRQ